MSESISNQNKTINESLCYLAAGEAGSEERGESLNFLLLTSSSLKMSPNFRLVSLFFSIML